MQTDGVVGEDLCVDGDLAEEQPRAGNTHCNDDDHPEAGRSNDLLAEGRTGWSLVADGRHILDPDDHQRGPAGEPVEALEEIVVLLAHGWVCECDHADEDEEGQEGENDCQDGWFQGIVWPRREHGDVVADAAGVPGHGHDCGAGMDASKVVYLCAALADCERPGLWNGAGYSVQDVDDDVLPDQNRNREVDERDRRDMLARNRRHRQEGNQNSNVRQEYQGEQGPVNNKDAMSETAPRLAPPFVWYRKRLLFQRIGSSGYCACVEFLLLAQGRVELCLGVPGFLYLFGQLALVNLAVKRQGEHLDGVPFGWDRIVRQFRLQIFV